MPCLSCKDEARCDRNGLCGAFRQELAKPTHRCDSCDTWYFEGDVPALCDSCERGVPVPAGVKEGGNG